MTDPLDKKIPDAVSPARVFQVGCPLNGKDWTEEDKQRLDEVLSKVFGWDILPKTEK